MFSADHGYITLCKIQLQNSNIFLFIKHQFNKYSIMHRVLLWPVLFDSSIAESPTHVLARNVN
jgi:hypothetical protein